MFPSPIHKSRTEAFLPAFLLNGNSICYPPFRHEQSHRIRLQLPRSRRQGARPRVFFENMFNLKPALNRRRAMMLDPDGDTICIHKRNGK